MFSAILMLSGSIFPRVGTVTEKAQVSAFVLTLGAASKFELDHWSCLGCLDGMNNKSKYEGCLDERGW